MEQPELAYEESQHLDELENEFYPMNPSDLLHLCTEHHQWLQQVTVEDEEWQIVD